MTVRLYVRTDAEGGGRESGASPSGGGEEYVIAELPHAQSARSEAP